jgi:RimJ/RimL family protein N-acetyltransferase
MMNWPQTDWLEPVTLEGRFIRLEPLDPDVHTEPMFAHFDKGVTEFLGRGGKPIQTVDALHHHLQSLTAIPNRFNWAVHILETGQVAGRISFSEVKPADHWLEIGTMLTRPFWGGVANPESKLLLMTRAFEVLRVRRVQFKVDARNERSQRAMDKLGAVREGVLRKYQVRADGFVRDSVVYSVLDDEWPGVKAKLLDRLSGTKSQADLEQYRSGRCS